MHDTIPLTDADCRRADAIWAEYQKQHDISALRGQAAGIDPHTGEVFFGRSAGDITRRLDGEGRYRPVVVFRVGYPYYARIRGGRRWSPGA